MKLLYYITHTEHFITLAHLFCKWKFVFLFLPHLLLFSSHSLSRWQWPVSSLYVWNCFLSFLSELFNLKILSRSTHVVENSKILYLFISFLWQCNRYVCYIFFIHSSIDRHVSCFHISVIVNKAATNIGLNISFKIHVFVLFR